MKNSSNLVLLLSGCLTLAASASSAEDYIQGKASKTGANDKLERPAIRSTALKQDSQSAVKSSGKISANDWNESFRSGIGSLTPAKPDSATKDKALQTDASFTSNAATSKPASSRLFNTELFESDKKQKKNARLSINLSSEEIKMLENYEITVLIDCSGSMQMEDCESTEWTRSEISRWDWCKEETAVLSRTLTSALPGINIITFSDNTQWYRNVPTKEINRIFDYNRPTGATALHLALDDAIRNYESNGSFLSKKKKLLIAVITDGMPDDPWRVSHVIDNISKEKNMSLVFFLIGSDYPGIGFIDRMRAAHPESVQVHFYDEVCRSGLAPILVQSIRSANLTQATTAEKPSPKKETLKPVARPFR